jgi:hypothetical protein
LRGPSSLGPATILSDIVALGHGLAIARGWLWLYESGTYVKFTQSGADLFA